ncbi:GAP1-N2 domain-containing protein [Sphaerisporangium sp. NPDC004334]
MAWQLHYTSAEAGPAGRAGFQFVAESPGLPPGLAGKVAPYLSYRPPPGAPLAPTPAEVARLPVALAYGPAGPRYVLTRCVYLGQDYSGRYGNYLGHAVVADPEELTGLRPVEFWQAPLWSDVPASSGTALPALTDLPPGDHVDPESLASWLASCGEAAYTRLGALLEAVVKALSQGHGRLVLVCADVEEIVRWIGVISYSLPWQVAARLPFCTYSADPGAAPQVIVGTTPDVWLPSDIDAAVVRLSEPPPAAGPPLGRFARTVAECWRRMDLAGIDAIGELRSAGGLDGEGFEPETSAALLALCRGDDSVTAEEQSAIARTLSPGLPDWLWSDLGRVCDRMEYELADAARALAPAETAELCAARCAVLALRDPTLPSPAPPAWPRTRETLRAEAARALADVRDASELVQIAATAEAVGAPIDPTGLALAARAVVRAGGGDLGLLLERVPPGMREAVLAGVVRGLEESAPAVRGRMLSDEVCDLLASRDLSSAPLTGTAVILSRVRRDRLPRVEATVQLIALHETATAASGPGPVPAAPHGPVPGAPHDPDPGAPHGPVPGAPHDPGPAAPHDAGPASGSPPHGAEDACGSLLPRAGDASHALDPYGSASSGAAPSHGSVDAAHSLGADANGDDVPAGALDAAVFAVWEQAPGRAECEALVRRLGAAMGRSPHLSDLPARTFLAEGVEDPALVGLAGLVRDTVPGYPAADAEVMLLVAGLRETADPAGAAATLGRLEDLRPESDDELLREALACAARITADREPRFRAEVMRRLPEEARTGLAHAWLEERRSRDEQAALLEVAVRLHLAGATVPELDAWARSQLTGWSPFGSADSRFKHDPELAAGLKEMAKGRRTLPWQRDPR